MKFNICLMNPPYDGTLHLKFLEKMIGICDKVVNISPVGWLRDPLGKLKNSSSYNKYEKTISKHIETLDVLSPKEATNLFGSEKNIQIAMELGIYVCSNRGGYDYALDDSFPIKLYKSREFPFKVGTYQDNKFENFVPIVSFTGCLKRGFPAMTCTNKYGAFANGYNNLHQTFEEAKKSNPSFTNGNIDNTLVAIFDTFEEAQNFYDMCNTDFWKFICYKSTVTNTINLKFLPWPNDYKKPWTDELLYKYFNLNQNEILEVKSTMKILYNKIDNLKK